MLIRGIFAAGSKGLLLALTFGLLAVPALLAQDPPPAPFDVVLSATDFSGAAGTQDDPFSGNRSIQLMTEVINDPNPSGYQFTDWSVRIVSGFFCLPCTATTCRFTGAEGPDPIFQHSRVRSDSMIIEFSVSVFSPGFQLETDSLQVHLRGEPGACDGGSGGEEPDSRPFNVNITTSSNSAPLGSTINLVGSARDATDNQLTFQFYDSTIQGVRGTLIGERVASNCTSSAGCSATLPFNVGFIPRFRYFTVVVSDGTNSRQSAQRTVNVVSENTGPGGEEDEDEVCDFGGGIQINANAGPPSLTVVGPSSVTLEGSARTSEGSNIPGVFRWTVVDDDGLGSQVSLVSPTSRTTVLNVPDVSVDRTVLLNFQASFNNRSCDDDIEVEILAEAPPEADLELASLNSSAANVPVGASVSFEALARNNGPAAASDVRIIFNIPANSFESASSGCALASGSLTDVVCEVGVLADEATALRTVTLEAGSVGPFSVNASVFGSDSDSVPNNSQSETIQVSEIITDLSLSKVADADAVSLDGQVTYSITVTNQGPEDATGVTVTDDLPAQLTALSASATEGGTCSIGAGSLVTCQIGDLAQGASVLVTIVARADAVGAQVVNTASVTADQGDSNSANNNGQAVISISDAEADLEISIVSVTPNPVGQERNLQALVTVANAGPDDVSGVQVTSVIPEGLSFLEADAGGGCQNNAGTVSCSLGSLDSGSDSQLTLTLQALGEGAVPLSAEVTFGGVDPDESNNTAEVEIRILGPNFLALPHTIGSDSFIGLGIVNRIGGENSLSIEGRDADGNIVNQTDREEEIAALGQDAFLTRDVPPSDTLIIRGNEGPFQAFFMIGDNSVRRLDGVGSEPQDGTDLFLPRVRQSGEDFTTIYLFNPDLEAVSAVTLDLFDLEGGQVGSAAFDLQPQGSILATAEELFGVSDLEDGYVHIDASLPIRGFELLKVDDNFATMMAQSAVSTPSLVSPHFLIGPDGAGTRLRLVNADDDVFVRVHVDAFDGGGQKMGGGTFDLSPSSVGVHELADIMGIDTSELDRFTLLQGHLEFELEGSVVGPFTDEAKVVPIISFDGIGKETLSSLPIPIEGQTETLFLHVAQSDDLNLFTGLAMFNNSGEPAQVIVEAFDRSGERTGMKEHLMDSGSRIIGLLDNSTFFGNFEQIGGYLRITSTQPIIAFALFGARDGVFLSAIGGQRPLQ
ncbi:MAG TPA: hypothetical protein VLU25_13510 [Acidobacteriota bacterium]|nr:hypothetical protein [Acidobacteriota bacterium]